MIGSLRSLPRTVWLLGLISLLNDSASELVYPLLPLYLSAVLLAGPKFLGLLEGLAESLSVLLKLYAGAWSDHFRNRKFPLVLGYSLAALARPLYVLAGSAAAVLTLRVLDRCGKALRGAPRDALLSDSVSPARRGLAFGVHRSMDHLGAVIGPLLAYGLIQSGVPIATVLMYAALPGALCVLLALAVRDTSTSGASPAIGTHAAPDSPLKSRAASAPEMRSRAASAPEIKSPLALIRWSNLPANYRRYLGIVALFALGNSSNIFLLLQAQALGLTAAHTLLCWALMAAVATLFSAPLGGYSDRIGRKPALLIGWALYVLVYVAFAFAPVNLAALLALFAAVGLIAAATEGVEKALIGDLLESAEGKGAKLPKATAFGWFYVASGLPLLPASLLFGIVWEQVDPRAAFLMSASIAFGALLLLWRWPRPDLPAR